MPWALGLQFYYAIADPKVGEEHILRKHSKWNSFQVIPDLFNSKKPQSSYYSAMQWATGLQFYYVIADPKVTE